MAVAYAVVVPGRFGAHAPSHQVYVRRRLVASLVLVVAVLAFWAGTSHVLASRGSAPASAPAVRPAATQVVSYVVQPGDTIWSIAQAHHGESGLSGYVDQLVSTNGGASLAIGQLLVLP